MQFRARQRTTAILAIHLGFSALSLATLGCQGEKPKYQPRPASSGTKANLPGVPNVPQAPIKAGDAYTVWGASYHLRSRVHRASIAGKDIKITGYITKTNLADAPKCAVHPAGKEDPSDCKAPIPAFWIGDEKDADEKHSIKVMGWASNYAQVYEAIKEYKVRAKAKKENADPLLDEFWGTKTPDPLPVKGAKVTVSGNYSTTFTKASSDAEANPIMGLLTYDEMSYQEKPEELATLPGVKP